MFGGGFWGAYAGSEDHLTRERDPPVRPIELEFPEYIPPFGPVPLTDRSSLRIRSRICHTRSFAEIGDDDILDLNIRLRTNVSIHSLVPDESFASRPLPYDDDLQSMLDEIGIENQDAFREVLRLPPLEGRSKPRLAYARNFFGSVEDMSRYFDNTQDHYYRVPVDAAKPEEQQNREQLADTKPAQDDRTKEVYTGYRISNAEGMNPGARIAMAKNLLKMVMHKFQCRDHEPIPQPREKLVFRGVKIQSVQYHFCVAKIPNDMKQARARFVEGPLLAVHVRDELRFKKRDRLHTPEKTNFVGERFDLFREIGCMLILACQRSRNSPDVTQNLDKPQAWWTSKQRWGGGATRWGQVSSEIFEDEDPSVSPSERGLRDEKRRKEEEQKAREATESRSSPTSAESMSLSVDDLIAASGKASLPEPSIEMRPQRRKFRGPTTEPPVQLRDGRRVVYTPPIKQKWFADWQKLRPGTPNIDSKIIGKQIGREGEADLGFDDIFLLSSCNHHVALSKMRVHAEYLEWLQTGKEVRDADDSVNRKDVLDVQRSTWYDMFDMDARKEFLTELWRLMCWLNRNEIPQSEYDKVEEMRRSLKKDG